MYICFYRITTDFVVEYVILYYFSELWNLDSDEESYPYINRIYLINEENNSEKSHVGKDRATIWVKIVLLFKFALKAKIGLCLPLAFIIGGIKVKFI